MKLKRDPLRLAVLALTLSAASAHAYYPPAQPNDPDPGIGEIRFFPEQYPNPPSQNGFSYTEPNSAGTDIFNGRDANGNRTFIFDSFSTAVTVGSAQPHFFGAWQNNTPGSITALHIQLYSDNNGDLGTLMYSGTYTANAAFRNGPLYTGPSAGPAVDPAYDRNRDFGTRNELYGQRHWFDGSTLTGPVSNNVVQIATPPARANGYTCCGPLPDNSTFWIGYSVDTTGGAFGAATNFVPTPPTPPAPAGVLGQSIAPVAGMGSGLSGINRYARTVVINDEAVAALEQALQTIVDPNATEAQKAAAQAVIAPTTNVVAILANTEGGTPPTLTPEQIATFGLSQTEFNSFTADSGEIVIDGQNVNLAMAPVPLPAPLVLLVPGLATLLVSRRVRKAVVV
jgi:hypothetical protein